MPRFSRAAVGLLASSLLACNLFTPPSPPPPVSTPSRPAPTAAASASPIPPSPTRTPVPATPSRTPPPPTASASPAPAGLNPAGPYVAFAGPGGVWLTNPDGSSPTQLTNLEMKNDLRGAFSPAGDRLAVVARTDQGVDLAVIKVPSGEVETTVRLASLTWEEEVANPLSERAFAVYAIRDYPNIAWQPGAGRWLAFTAAIDGPTSDMYGYDTRTQTVQRWTDGPSQAIEPIWSPRGDYLLNYGVSWVNPSGGAISGADRLDGVWAMRLADEKVISLPKPKGEYPNFIGWRNDTQYLTYDSDETCYAQNLHTVDAASGAETPWLDLSFYLLIAQSPVNGTVLFSSTAGCPNSLGEGVFLYDRDEPAPVQLLAERAYEIHWLPESNVFQAYPGALFSADGQTRFDLPVFDASYDPAISRQGYQAWNVIENRRGRIVVKIPGQEWRTILEGISAKLLWDPADGGTLLMALEDGALYAATYPDFAPRLMSEQRIVSDAIWLR